MTQALDVDDWALASVMNVMHTMVTINLLSTSEDLAFRRDVFLGAHLISNWQAVPAPC